VAEFQALSGVYIKFGQLLATRPDLLPPEVGAALDDLFDEVPPEPLSQSRLTLAEDWPDDIASGVDAIDETPIAGASFASVYKGRLKDGTTVAIKVQRRDILALTLHDLRVIRLCARLIDFSGILGRFRLSQFVDEFETWTHEELDYVREARHMEYLRQHLPPNSQIVIPRVFWQYSSTRVLVMDYLEGTWLTTLTRAESQSAANKALARKVFQEFMFQIFELGFYHADPHPGNLCVLADDRIGLIDFGIVGSASKSMRRTQLDLLWAMQRSDLEDAFQAVLNLSVVPQDADVERFRRAFERNLTQWLLMQYQPQLPPALRGGMRLMFVNLSAAGRCGIQIKSRAARYYRTLMVLENVALRIDSAFHQQHELSRYFRERFVRNLIADGRPRENIQWMAGSWHRIEGLLRQLMADTDAPVPTSRLNRTALVAGRLAKLGSRALIAIGLLSLALVAAATVAPDFYNALAARPGLDGVLVERLGTISAGAAAIAAALLLRWTARLLWIHADEPGPYLY
jgi:ubiquinone biosynthesis protein